MSDYELDPKDPEYEYAPSSWQRRQEGSYRTGSTTPPRDYGWVVTAVLVMVIVFGGIGSTLSMLNLQPEPVSAQREEDPITSVSNGTVSSSLEETEATQPQEAAQPTSVGNAMLQISDSPESLDNIAQEGALSWQQVYEKVIPSVVSITCNTYSGTSTGTGVVMTRSGYLITNAHVVDNAQSIEVLLTDGRTMDASVVGSDSVSDLAVLFIQADNLTSAEFGSSSALRVGDAVVAIGDPLGIALRGTMTDGIISAINRDLTTGGRTMSLIQTTAALNSGNSGGPLVNCYGQVIGINTMKIGDYASTAGVEGLGFAIPMSTVKDVVEQLIHYGYVAGRPTLGLEGQMVSTFYQMYYRLPAGMMLTSVDTESDAYQKGLMEGDILLQANGQQITATTVLDEVVNSCQVGDVVNIILYRAGQEYTVDLTVTEVRH